VSYLELYDDALRIVTGWAPTNVAGADARRRTLQLLSAGPVSVQRDHAEGHVTASAVIVSSDLDRVLLCLHGRINKWVQVGGHCEPTDRTLAQAALREATEESGIDGLVIDADPVDIDIHDVTCASGPTHHYDVRYLIVAPVGAIERVSAESHALGWFEPDALPSPLASATESVVMAALAAARS
jgi:8-oxo-dGTP pyrophosphatase MutT (NUDIX family)